MEAKGTHIDSFDTRDPRDAIAQIVLAAPALVGQFGGWTFGAHTAREPTTAKRLSIQGHGPLVCEHKSLGVQNMVAEEMMCWVLLPRSN